VLSTFRIEGTSRWEELCFLQTQEMGDGLRLWEDQCKPMALKRAEAREKVAIHAREERGSKRIMEICRRGLGKKEATDELRAVTT